MVAAIGQPGDGSAGGSSHTPPDGSPKQVNQAPSGARRRRLRAVFAADITGFSGRMSLNETSTVHQLSEIRIIGRRALDAHDGWLFGMAGDGLFATFESAVSAVQCALQVQSELIERQDLRDMPLRIGIHLGEVLMDDDLPYGETLNIAARLEALADPGGILISGTVLDAVSSRVSATFEDRGVPHLKNIPRRIPTYAVKPPPKRSPADETRIGLSSLDQTTRLDRSALRDLIASHETAPGIDAPQSTGTTSQISSSPENPAVAETPAEVAGAVAGPVSGPAARPECAERGGDAAPAMRRPTDAFITEITKALAEHVGPLAKLIVQRELNAGLTNFDLITQLEKHVPTDAERLTFRVRASHINATQRISNPQD